MRAPDVLDKTGLLRTLKIVCAVEDHARRGKTIAYQAGENKTPEH